MKTALRSVFILALLHHLSRSLFVIPENCTQLYPRIFFTPQTVGQGQTYSYIIKFNTPSACSQSYTTVIYRQGQNQVISKFYCTSQSLSLFSASASFATYIQTCPVHFKSSGNTFRYSVYGQDSRKALKGIIDEYQVYLPRLESLARINLVFTADWGPLKVKKYTPIYGALRRRIQQGDSLHGMVILGDLAYNLDSNSFQQYYDFMGQLAQISPYLPMISVVGNHENFTHNNNELFVHTFEAFNISLQDVRVQAFDLFNLRIVGFNPFDQIYSQSKDEDYRKMRLSLLRALQERSNDQDQQIFLILTSHYPVICSQDVFHCRQTLKSLPSLYAEISNTRQVDLYVGAHMHQYERIFPYINATFDPQKNSTIFKGQMPSIVQGVAGCDVGIIEEDFPVEYFSAKHDWNYTGFGILSVSDIGNQYPTGTYQHFRVTQQSELELFDEVKIVTQRRPSHEIKAE